MKSGKTIDISKSSLVSLKAELIRKKEEAEKLKGTENYVKLPPKPKPEVKTNPGVSQRHEKDVAEELSTEEVDLLKKSKDVLTIKAALYDQLQSGSMVPEDGKSRFLVDFERKEKLEHQATGEIGPLPPSHSEEAGRQSSDDAGEEDYDDLDDSEWIEYKDCLGRSRKCLKADLPSMKRRDEFLSKTLLKEAHKKEEPSTSTPKTEDDELRELVSNDMHLEEMRKKWEQKETELLSKQNVYYEDLLFDGSIIPLPQVTDIQDIHYGAPPGAIMSGMDKELENCEHEHQNQGSGRLEMKLKSHSLESGLLESRDHPLPDTDREQDSHIKPGFQVYERHVRSSIESIQVISHDFEFQEDKSQPGSQLPCIGGYLQSVIPDEIILEIFSYVGEKDLCNLSRVCKRFNRIACDNSLWKRLYHQVFEYDLPLFNPEPCVFQFKQPSECGYNPWKESFRQLYRGIHVYPPKNQGGSGQKNQGDSLKCRMSFSSLREAVNYAQQNQKSDVIPIIFIHSGEYEADDTGEDIAVNFDVAIIGAGRGNVSDNVVIRKGKSTSTDTGITFTDGARNAYLGHVSLRPVSSPPEAKFVNVLLLSVRSSSSPVSPTIEHCNIGSPSAFYLFGVHVSGDTASPTIRNCRITNCDYGIYITDADGVYEENVISGNNTGIGVDLSANPIIRKNDIFGQNSEGVYFDSGGSGVLEHNEIHDNPVNICIYDRFTSKDWPNLAIIKSNRICRGSDAGIHISDGSGVIIEENDFSQNNGTDVRIIDHSYAILRNNNFDGSNDVVTIQSESNAALESNSFRSKRI